MNDHFLIIKHCSTFQKKQVIRHEPAAASDEVLRQHRVAAKAELSSRMEEEAKISKVNGLKILNQWRKIMRIAKTESLKNDVEILSKNHERDISRKDAILLMLDRCPCIISHEMYMLAPEDVVLWTTSIYLTLKLFARSITSTDEHLILNTFL